MCRTEAIYKLYDIHRLNKRSTDKGQNEGKIFKLKANGDDKGRRGDKKQ